jgi:hypothetical protein
MKKTKHTPESTSSTKKGYNEKNPGQPQGAFPPASNKQNTQKEKAKSNTADKKQKEDQE